VAAPAGIGSHIGAVDHAGAQPSLNRIAVDATVHCLTGCAIGEVLGLVIATALGWHDLPSVVLTIALAFVFAVPGAMAAGLTDVLFWGSLALALGVAFVVALPVNRWLIARGWGHAVVPGHH
jgi:cation transporter-like permease